MPKNLQIVEYESSKVYSIHLNYNEYQPFLNKIKGKKAKILETNFDDGASLVVVASDSETIENAVVLQEFFEYYEEEK